MAHSESTSLAYSSASLLWARLWILSSSCARLAEITAREFPSAPAKSPSSLLSSFFFLLPRKLQLPEVSGDFLPIGLACRLFQARLFKLSKSSLEAFQLFPCQGQLKLSCKPSFLGFQLLPFLRKVSLLPKFSPAFNPELAEESLDLGCCLRDELPVLRKPPAQICEAFFQESLPASEPGQPLSLPAAMPQGPLSPEGLGDCPIGQILPGASFPLLPAPWPFEQAGSAARQSACAGGRGGKQNIPKCPKAGEKGAGIKTKPNLLQQLPALLQRKRSLLLELLSPPASAGLFFQIKFSHPALKSWRKGQEAWSGQRRLFPVFLYSFSFCCHKRQLFFKPPLLLCQLLLLCPIGPARSSKALPRPINFGGKSAPAFWASSSRIVLSSLSRWRILSRRWARRLASICLCLARAFSYSWFSCTSLSASAAAFLCSCHSPLEVCSQLPFPLFKLPRSADKLSQGLV